jgi:hypothetical protein
VADRPYPGNRPRPAADVALDLARGRTARRVTEAVQAAAIRVRIRSPLRFPDSYSATATVFWSIALDAPLCVLRPPRETVRNPKPITTRAGQ